MTENEIAKTLNDFFSNTIKPLGIPKFDQVTQSLIVSMIIH